MTAQIIDGKAFGARVREQVARQVSALKERHGLTPGLTVVIVGDDPASQVYVRNKGKAAAEVGIASDEIALPADTPQEELMAVVERLNGDRDVHGILVQLPLPDGLDELPVLDAIDPAKDVDGLHVVNAGRLSAGLPALVPCTPRGAMMMLEDQFGPGGMSGLSALVVGRSRLVGKPMAQLLLAQHCTVTMAHSRTRDLPERCLDADILVAAVGVPRMIKGEWVKPGATVIDVGINRIDEDRPGRDNKTRLVGDVDYEAASEVAGAITPVPGGVGVMTVACLLANTVTAACRQAGVEEPEI
jgi:methylenetetrahydrofolate dehydrogenase (NADP+)/methenyltetrahydrofolate cyclohydrolase